MTNPVREHLIGYLLDAVDADQRTLVEQHLQQDESVARELEVLRAALHPLAADKRHHHPPAGLARRCCDFVYARSGVMPASLSALRGAAAVAPVRPRWTILDKAVAAAIAIAAAVLFVPAIYQSHVQSQLLACQNNLKDFGTALTDYSERHEGYYPAVQPGENPSGWAPTLVSQKYLTHPSSNMVCPSGRMAKGDNLEVPTEAEFQKLSQDQQSKILLKLARTYGYTLGYNDKNSGAYKIQRNEHRKNFAVLADAPGQDGAASPNHGGNGQNVLYDDDHYAFVKNPPSDQEDDIYHNIQGKIAPGLHSNDAVIVTGDSGSK